LATRPHPIIFPINPTTTKPRENKRMLPVILSILVFNPILAKKIGPNSI
jgi:hypothetical protein